MYTLRPWWLEEHESPVVNDATGSVVWQAGLALSIRLLCDIGTGGVDVQGKTVVELGSGTGLVRKTTATHCNTLQHTAAHCSTLQHTAAHCNALQHTATHCNCKILLHTAAHCNTLQHTAAHCYTLLRTATHYNTLQHTATYRNTL